MLEKPKYLTGEVKEFIELLISDTKQNPFPDNSYYTLTYDEDTLIIIALFLNQPFTSEMVNEYFRGLENQLVEQEFDLDWIMEQLNPLTLNHFISDIIRFIKFNQLEKEFKFEWRE